MQCELSYRIVVGEVCIRLQPCSIHELNDSVYYVHAVAQTAETSEETPREEVID